MKDLRSGCTFLSVLLMITLSGTFAVAEYHHVNDCIVCHSGSASYYEDCSECSNLKGVRCDIDTPSSGNRQVVFSASYVRGEEPYDGICEVCHTQTTYYRNNSSGNPHPEYQPGLGGPGTDCMLCHKHAPYEFGHEATIGTGCDPCHGHEGGDGTAFSHATHTEGTVARGPAAAMDCNVCHDANNYPLFGDENAKETLDATTVCDGCHSLGGAYGGSQMAKAEWSEGVYVSGGAALKAGKEDWCAHCHDDDPAVIGPRTAKNVTGDDVVFGYYVSGHGHYNTSCADCHDPQVTHIDGYARTYDAEDPGNPDRSYRNGYRLILVDGGDPLMIPRPWDYDPSYFALCYQCHREEVVVGGGGRPGGQAYVPYEDAPLQTYFANLSVLGDFSGNSGAPDPPNNVHVESHLATGWNPTWDSDRDTDMGFDSAISCPTCHDPHSKSAYLYRATHSMTRADLGIAYRREIEGWSAWTNRPEYMQPGGDLYCEACHVGGQSGSGPSDRYYFMLGTALGENEDPAFYTRLDEGDDITNPQYGVGGELLGGSFATYERNGTRTGLLVENIDEGCRFPVNNLNADQDVIDFWYVPSFDFSGDSEDHCLVEGFSSPSDYLRIEVKPDHTLVFSINNDGVLRGLKSNHLNWTAGTAHHIRCTWGVYGIHMYLDGDVEEYAVDSGTDHFGGMNETSLPQYLFIGRRQDDEEQKPANGIIDDLKIYGYQYQKFEQPLAFFSRLGTLDEVQNPDIGAGGNTVGDVNFFGEGDTPGPDYPPWRYSVHGYSVGIYDDQYLGSYKGVIRFPTSNLNVAEDTIDFWWAPMFSVASNAGSRVLFYCSHDPDNVLGIRLYLRRLHFIIKVEGETHELYTAPIDDLWYDTSGDVRDGYWFHVVCSWGDKGMHIYINDREAVYHPDYDDGLDYKGGLGDLLPEYFLLGNNVAGGDSHMDSMMDELRIYGYQPEAISPFPKKPQKSKDHAF